MFLDGAERADAMKRTGTDETDDTGPGPDAGSDIATAEGREAARSAPRGRGTADRRRGAAALARRLGLVMVAPEALSWSRRRSGRGFVYLDAEGRPIRDPAVKARLVALAVPPAYVAVGYAPDPNAHLQAIGRDAEGRQQYRYHALWEEVRERLKADRLARLATALPRIRRRIVRDLAAAPGERRLALAAVVELVTQTAIRPGGESYAREHGTRGATTLLKSDLRRIGGRLELRFRAKGDKAVVCPVNDDRLAGVLAALAELPGRRLFQYRGEDGAMHPVASGEVNAYLREIAGTAVSLKDFRTLVASAGVLQALADVEPETSERRRNAQVAAAIREAAEVLRNTPAICRRSYVLPAVVRAFEDGTLTRFARRLKRCRSAVRRAEVLAGLIRHARRHDQPPEPPRGDGSRRSRTRPSGPRP